MDTMPLLQLYLPGFRLDEQMVFGSLDINPSLSFFFTVFGYYSEFYVYIFREKNLACM